MGRKSLAEKRREAILAAFERCIVRYGIDVPLEQIADEAGVQRSLIRHYLGNRDEVVDLLIERIAAAYPERVAAQLHDARERGYEGLLDVFFATDIVTPEWDDAIMAVVSTGRGRYSSAKARVGRMVRAIITHVEGELATLFPNALPDTQREAAYGLVCLAQGSAELSYLGLDTDCAQARANAHLLLERLRSTSEEQR